ncbi:hypothetical protein [Pseudomonas chlororaphis]|uniref:hypothetical protein n=1 Tax=Pseudomonas chlororaphis TaxID=587753 RepID=UPI00117B0D11|nr:hypothetical protein [Pseudomonas chlororaphis]
MDISEDLLAEQVQIRCDKNITSGLLEKAPNRISTVTPKAIVATASVGARLAGDAGNALCLTYRYREQASLLQVRGEPASVGARLAGDAGSVVCLMYRYREQASFLQVRGEPVSVGARLAGDAGNALCLTYRHREQSSVDRLLLQKKRRGQIGR